MNIQLFSGLFFEYEFSLDSLRDIKAFLFVWAKIKSDLKRVKNHVAFSN